MDESQSQLSTPVRLRDKLAQVTEQWTPRVVAQLNDYDLLVVKIEGEFIWHTHPETDELFLLLDGQLTIRLREGGAERAVTLEPGDLFVVPRGIEHQPFAAADAQILLNEPRGTPNTGDSATAAPRRTL